MIFATNSHYHNCPLFKHSWTIFWNYFFDVANFILAVTVFTVTSLTVTSRVYFTLYIGYYMQNHCMFFVFFRKRLRFDQLIWHKKLARFHININSFQTVTSVIELKCTHLLINTKITIQKKSSGIACWGSSHDCIYNAFQKAVQWR